MDDDAVLTVEEAADRLGVSRSLCYELIGRGELAVLRIGRLTRVPAAALRAFVAENTGAGPRAPGARAQVTSR